MDRGKWRKREWRVKKRNVRNEGREWKRGNWRTDGTERKKETRWKKEEFYACCHEC